MDILSSIGNTMNAISSSFIGKLGILTSSAIVAFFAPILGILFACFALNAVDLITGLHAAIKQGKSLKSKKTWQGTISKVELEAVMLTALHAIEHFVINASFDAATTVMSGGAALLVCLTEAWSIAENLNKINPDGPWRVLQAFINNKGEELTGVKIKEYDNNNTGDTLSDIQA